MEVLPLPELQSVANNAFGDVLQQFGYGLLASAYGLELIGSRDAPDGSEVNAVESWLEDFPNRCVAHTSFHYCPSWQRCWQPMGFRPSPFCDTHLTCSFRSARSPNAGRAKKWTLTARGRSLGPLAGRDLDDPAVMEYVIDGFSDEITWLKGWHDGGVPIVRFELLEAAPSRVLAQLATALGQLYDDQIMHAVEMCPAENLVRAALCSVGGCRQCHRELGASDFHKTRYPSLRDRYGDDVRQSLAMSRSEAA